MPFTMVIGLAGGDGFVLSGVSMYIECGQRGIIDEYINGRRLFLKHQVLEAEYFVIVFPPVNFKALTFSKLIKTCSAHFLSQFAALE